MSRIPTDLIERIKREVSVADLCRDYGIVLQPKGKDLFAACPWHEDSDPSFSVTPGKNLWNCLGGCGGGDSIQLVMRCEKISFRRAAEQLLAKLGVAPPAEEITTRMGTTHEILAAPGDGLTDGQLMEIVTDFYHQTFLNQPQAMQYLQKRKCFHPEAVKRFRIGYANRTLGYRVPITTAAGRELKEHLQKLGVLRKETGHEHLNGSIVFPICDRNAVPVQMYGRKITEGLRKGTPLHLYLEQPKRGVWNPESVMAGGEVILCEAILDALTFWCAGFRNVTCSFGAGGLNEELWKLLHDKRPRWVICAHDNDAAGNEGVAKIAPRLAELGIGVKRVQLPPSVDVNAFACQSADVSRALAGLLEEAHVLVTHAAEARAQAVASVVSVSNAEVPPPLVAVVEEKTVIPEPAPIKASEPPASFLAAAVPANALHCEQRGEDLFCKLGDREYRVRGLAKNASYEALKINLRVLLRTTNHEPSTESEARYHQDNLDMVRAKDREHFARVAALETQLKEDVLKRDLSRLLLKLEELQDENIRRASEPKGPVVPGMTDAERDEALALLRDPKLLDRILADFEACGVVGEDTNKLVGYLAALSRKFDKPLGIIIQSTSAAGKTTLMEAVLAFMPPEEVIKYSAMTGQALFYLGEQDIRHKILAIAEEEGAERATYALKLLQSEGELTIASTGKDSNTGRHVTEIYYVKGPIMLFFTTTATDIDEELQNRNLTMSVDESRAQTRRIHELQREEETIEGHLRKVRAETLRATHRNAQRLLQSLPVHNPFARRLTFPDENTRLRRDQKKYLTLIRAIALLHQHQRPRRKVEGVEHVEVSLEDIATANRLAGEILGRSLDEMSPQTRRFLELLHQMVTKACAEKTIDQRNHRFSQRDVRAFSGWSAFQVKKHLGNLVDLEYALIHRGGRGQSFVYELLYSGEGDEGSKFVMGLIDVDKLRASDSASAARTYDGNREHQNGHREPTGSPLVAAKLQGGSVAQIVANPSNHAGSESVVFLDAENHVLEAI